MEAAFNGDMLKIARKAKGYSQQELAALVGIPQGSYSKIENGFHQPSSEATATLADRLGVTEGFFFQKGGILQPATPHHRSRASLREKTKDTVEAIANIYRLHVSKMLEQLDLTYNIVQVTLIDRSPAEVAAITRRNLKLARGPIENLTKILEGNGLFVIGFDFGTKQLDGFTVQGNEVTPMVFLNSAAPSDRNRFTLAHELGHLIMHSQDDGLSDLESEANAFASCFLLPEEDIKRDLYDLSLEKLAALKRKWRVSMAALIHRAKDLNTISPDQEKQLWIRMSINGYRKNEPIQVPAEAPSLTKEMVDLYLNDLGYTKAELAQFLLLKEVELQKYFDVGRFKLRIVRGNAGVN